MISKEDAGKLSLLSDRLLARVANRYKHEPVMTIISGRKSRTKLAPDWAKAFYGAWSDIDSTHLFLKEQFGVEFIKDTYTGWSDGDYEPNYNSKWGPFKFYGNYYDFECFIPVLRWAIENRLKEVN